MQPPGRGPARPARSRSRQVRSTRSRRRSTRPRSQHRPRVISSRDGDGQPKHKAYTPVERTTRSTRHTHPACWRQPRPHEACLRVRGRRRPRRRRVRAWAFRIYYATRGGGPCSSVTSSFSGPYVYVQSRSGRVPSGFQVSRGFNLPPGSMDGSQSPSVNGSTRHAKSYLPPSLSLPLSLPAERSPPERF